MAVISFLVNSLTYLIELESLSFAIMILASTTNDIAAVYSTGGVFIDICMYDLCHDVEVYPQPERSYWFCSEWK